MMNSIFNDVGAWRVMPLSLVPRSAWNALSRRSASNERKRGNEMKIWTGDTYDANFATNPN
ncbi:MAG: hypothetical protein GY943_11080 [Chloroflexi bacterium]|nr:hypothetical protein [Chloroflexota bacterium]